MKLKIYINQIILLSIILIGTVKAQEKLELFPSNLLVQPFSANTLKPKLGFEFKNGKNELSLNIGNSIDILHYQLDDKSKLSFGADLFTYTLLRSQSDFHFPVDAVDYLFGVNFGYVKQLNNSKIGARLRISHISAHFVDGHYDKDNQQWRDGRNPKVYSREFFEFIPYYSFNNLRIYAGITYIYSIDPRDIGQDQYQLGFEYFGKDLISESITPYLAYDFRIINLYQYTGNNSLEAGIKLGKVESRGISFYFRYFSGYNIHGEYFDLREDFTSIGFNLDL
jgi:hypothetical protein